MKFTKITTITLWVIMGISIFMIISLLSNLGEGADPNMDTWLNVNLSWSYVLLCIAGAAALVMEFLNMLADRKALKSALVGIGLLAAVLLISYMFSDSSIPKFYGAEKFVEDGILNNTVSLWIDTGLIATYILSAVAFVTIIWSSVSGFFK